MPQATLDTVVSHPLFDRLPFRVAQASSKTSSALMLLLLVPAVAVLLAPLALLAAFATPALWAAAEHPAAAAQVAAGLAIWTVLFVVPAKRIIQRFATSRDVCIEPDLVTVRERGPFGTRVWTVPLAEFSGVAHHVRSNLSGVHHELFLVHACRGKSLLVHAGEAIPQATIDRAARLLGLPHLPAAALYRFGTAAPRLPVPAGLVVTDRLAA